MSPKSFCLTENIVTNIIKIQIPFIEEWKKSKINSIHLGIEPRILRLGGECLILWASGPGPPPFYIFSYTFLILFFYPLSYLSFIPPLFSFSYFTFPFFLYSYLFFSFSFSYLFYFLLFSFFFICFLYYAFFSIHFFSKK